MKWFLTFLLLTSLLLAACDGTPLPNQDAPRRVSTTTTQTIKPIKTSTPTPAGTWKTVIDGVIYDRHTEPGKPIVGASVSYDVLHSHFAQLQGGSSNKTVTDEHGAFALPVIVHDTDSVRILVEAQGYAPYEERLVGVDLLGGKRFDIGLTPLQSATVNPPLPTSSKR